MAYLRLPLLDCCTALSLCRQATLHKNREFQLKPGQLVLDILRTVVGSSCKRHILYMNIENIQQNMELLSRTQPQHCLKHNYLNTVATRRVQTFGGNLVYCLACSRLGTASISPGERIHPHHTHTHPYRLQRELDLTRPTGPQTQDPVTRGKPCKWGETCKGSEMSPT